MMLLGSLLLIVSGAGTSWMTIDQHAAIVRFVEVFSGVVRETPASELPEDKRQVFLRHGEIVATRQEADEVVPVVEVRRLTLDDRGDLVPADRATRVRIEEVGPEGRPLRWTSMTRQSR